MSHFDNDYSKQCKDFLIENKPFIKTKNFFNIQNCDIFSIGITTTFSTGGGYLSQYEDWLFGIRIFNVIVLRLTGSKKRKTITEKEILELLKYYKITIEEFETVGFDTNNFTETTRKYNMNSFVKSLKKILK